MEGQRYIIDRVGEETDLANCSVCHAISCFSCVQEYCTALEKAADGGCVFYKDAEDNRREIRRCFYRLIRYERFDLLYKHADTMAALGLMNQELKDAEKQRMMLDEYQRTHLAQLCADHWKDSLIVVSASDEEDNNKDDAPADSETQEPDPESEFDNDLDKAVFPETFTDMDIDDETAEEINTRDHIIKEEIKDGQFRPSALAADILEQQEPTADREVNLPPDYPEDFDETESLTYDEWMEEAEEKELAREIGQEKAAANAEYERDQADNGNTGYVSVPLNFLYKRIGYPVRQKQQPDPVVLAYENLGAGIVYTAAEEYIETLRLLWYESNGEYEFPRLIVRMWQLETYMGSQPYWLYTDINPNRLLDQCRKTAKERTMAKIERMNRRIAAGLEGGEEM